MPPLSRPLSMTWMICLLMIPAVSSVTAVEMRPRPEGQNVLMERVDGVEVYTFTSAPDATLQAVFIGDAPLTPGWYRLDAEYRTTGLSRMDFLNAKICPLDYSKWYSSSDRIQAAADWSRLAIFFNATSPKTALFELNAPEGSPRGAGICLRNLTATPYTPTQGVNLAPNVDFAKGAPGEFPACWSWQFHGIDGAYEWVAAESCRRGANAVRLTPPKDKVITLQGVNLPLPPDGTIAFTVWARTNSPGMTLRLFLLGDNYKWNVSKDFLPTESWMKFSISGECPPERGNSFFWPRIDAVGTGTLDVVGESVVWNSVSDAPSSEWIPPIGSNLLVNPGFELGMNGWQTDSFDPKDAPDYALRSAGYARVVAGEGVDGGSALQLSPHSPSLVANCVPTQQGETFAMSASLRGAAPGAKIRMFLIDTNWHFIYKDFDDLPTDGWKRCEWTQAWDSHSKGKRVYARIDATGDVPVYIDNVQLEKGNVTPYAPSPVSIGFVADGPNLHDQGSAASPTLRVIPSRELAGELAVELVACDAWGREAWRKTLTAPADSRTDLPVEVPTDILGNIHVAATVRPAAGGDLLGNASWRYAVIAPRDDKPADGGYVFGIDYELYNIREDRIEPETVLMNRIGVGINRFFLGLSEDPGGTGAPILELVKKKAAILRKAGIESVACISSVPAKLHPKVFGLEELDDAALRDYADFLRPIVVALKDEIRGWEVLNEPNLWRVADGPDQGKPTMPPEKYLKMLKAAHAVIKSVDPTLTVMAPCLNGNDFTYLEDLMKRGMAPYMDTYSFHPYRSSPDLPDTYTDLMHMRKILEQGGFTGPMLNTEQYFSCDRFELHGADGETSRGYYLRGWQELPTAGRTVRNFIHHAAAGIPYCAFAPDSTLFSSGGTDRYFTFDLLPAYAAAHRFLASAGRGHPLKSGAAMRAFVFPEAAEGPLLALYAPETDFKGSIAMKGDFTAFDIMGNPLPADAPLPLAGDPIYLRFTKGLGEAEVAKALSEAVLSGIGDPFIVSIALTAERRLTVSLLNRLNRTSAGTATLTRLPADWQCKAPKAEFSGLEPDMTAQMSFDIDAAAIMPLGTYPVEVVVESDGRSTRTTTDISPLFATRLGEVQADGNLDEWKDAEWVPLGENNLSADFNPDLPHEGAKDLSASIACGWNQEFFALAVKVEDDTFTPATSPLQAYGGDSLQLYFDPLDDAPPTSAGYGQDDIAYCVSKIGDEVFAYLERGSEGRYIGEANKSTGLDSEVKVAVTRKGNVTTYEIVFPAKTLPGATLADGKSFGFSLLINDNDGKGRKMGLTLAPKGAEPFNAPNLFKNIILVEPPTP